MRLNAGPSVAGERPAGQVKALECPWEPDLSCSALGGERDPVTSRCPWQPKLTQDSILGLSGEAAGLLAELETEQSLANTENLHH